MSRAFVIVCCLAGATTLAPDASAQTANRVAVGVNVSSRLASAPENRGSTHVGFQWRLGHSDQGWGWKYGLNWYSTHVDGSVDGRSLEIGELHVRPIMAGYGYTHVVGGTAISTNLLAGFSFNTFSLDERAGALYRDATASRDVSTGARNTFVLYPEMTVWRDLNRKVGVQFSAGYMFARPDVTVKTTGGTYRHSIRADVLRIKVGAVYSVF